MLFEKGFPARLAAGLDRKVTNHFALLDPIDQKDTAKKYQVSEPTGTEEGNREFEVHRRLRGEVVLVRTPNGESIDIHEGSIVHVYEKGELVERKWLKDVNDFVVLQRPSPRAKDKV